MKMDYRADRDTAPPDTPRAGMECTLERKCIEKIVCFVCQRKRTAPKPKRPGSQFRLIAAAFGVQAPTCLVFTGWPARP